MNKSPKPSQHPTVNGVMMPYVIIRSDGKPGVFVPDEYINNLIDRGSEEMAKIIHDKDFLK